MCIRDRAKGEFAGSEAIAKIKADGPAKRLVGLSVEQGVPRHGFPVLHDGVEVGSVASGTFSPTLEHGIATAYVPAALADPGTPLEVSIRRKTVAVTVVKMPFVTGTSLSAK